MFNYSDYCQRRKAMLNKSAVAVLTPEAMQAAMQPPPPDPAAMGGAPMDPTAMGGMMPPGGAPMPPQGALMDPAMMGGQPPMDPAMGGAPAGGLPPEAMQDQLFLQFLAEAFGIMLDPRSGQFFDQNGQPVPPEMLMQAYQAYMSGMQQLQAQGIDPNAMGGAPMPGGMPPMDPAAMGGAAPMDPAMAAGGAPMPPAGEPPMDMPAGDTGAAPQGGDQAMDPMMQELADLMVAVMEDTIVAPMKEELAAIQKQFADLKELLKTVRDDMGTIRTDVDAQESRAEENDVLRSEIAAELEPTVDQPKEDEPQEKQATLRPLNILDILGGK